MRATQLRPGMTIRHEGELFTVHSVEHRTPGNKRAAMATKMRNLRTGSIIDYRFRAEVDIERGRAWRSRLLPDYQYHGEAGIL